MKNNDFLGELHRVTKPRTYLEVGVNLGNSLGHSRVPSIGIDPDYTITSELQADIHLARTTSDEFFARPRPLAHLPIPVLDLVFIDGMHLAEYALRDFLAVERFLLPTSVVMIDDVLPRSIAEAERKRTQSTWAGDVYKALEALRALRPDLEIIEVDTRPTGTAIVLFPDARRNGVLAGYDDWVETAITPDPQDVPAEVLKRSRAVSPEALLNYPGWERLTELRGRAKAGQYDEVREALGGLTSLVG